MKKLASKAIVAISLLHLSIQAHADGQYGCVTGESAGFNWDKGNWKYTRFTENNVLISIKSNNTKMEFKVAGSQYPTSLDCQEFIPTIISCSSKTGSAVIFNTESLKGGYSSILGAVIENPNYKDSLAVSTLTCQMF